MVEGPEGRPFEKVGVVGAGMMGSEIALMFALAGHPTILSDQERAAADEALERLHGLVERGTARGFWSTEQGEAARHNLKAVNGFCHVRAFYLSTPLHTQGPH